MIKFCSLVSSSKGNSVLISDGKTNILVDCGISRRRMADALSAVEMSISDIDAILVTHEHGDHNFGVGAVSRGFDIPIYATTPTWEAMADYVGNVDQKNIKCIKPGESFEIKTIGAVAFNIPHDAAGPVGYSFNMGNLKASVATDMGCIEDSVMKAISGSDIILLEANHDVEMLKKGRYPQNLKQRILGRLGHLSNELSAEISVNLLKSGTRAILLGHLSEENNTPAIAYNEVKNALEKAGASVDKDIRLAVASRYEISGMY